MRALPPNRSPRAYGHAAARYFRRLGELDGTIDDYGPVVDHETFVDELRQRHGRKSSFWKKAEIDQ